MTSRPGHDHEPDSGHSLLDWIADDRWNRRLALVRRYAGWRLALLALALAAAYPGLAGLMERVFIAAIAIALVTLAMSEQ